MNIRKSGQFSYFDEENIPPEQNVRISPEQNVRHSTKRHDDSMVISCLVNMENGSSSRSTEAFLKTLKNENLLNEDVRIPCSSTVSKYNRALKTLTEEQINEFIANSKSAQIGFGELHVNYFLANILSEHFERTILSKRT